MNHEDVKVIIAEISNLKNLGISLSENLNCERIMSEFEHIEEQSRQNRYVLPKMYSLIKRIQKSINASLYNNDINAFVTLFSTVEAVRKKLGEEYQKRSDIASKVRNIKALINEDPAM